MKKKNFRGSLWHRLSALLIVLVMLAGIGAPVLAEGQSYAPLTIASESEILLPDDYVAEGEVVIGLSPTGEQMLPIELATTDIILSSLMDVSDAVDRMNGSERKAAFGTAVKQEGCALVLARSASMDTQTLIDQIKNCEGVLFVEENRPVIVENDDTQNHTPAVNDNEQPAKVTKNEAFRKYEWFLDNTFNPFEGQAGIDLNLKNIPSEKRGSDQTVIAVLDTGIDYNHPDLKNRMIHLSGRILNETGCGEYGFNATNDEDHSDPMDDYLHGTHCAGIIAGASKGISGVMNQAKLCAVKVMDGSGNGSTANVIAGIDWIRQAKEIYGVNIATVNMSLGDGTKCDLGLKLAVKALDEAEITLCLAAGNESNNLDLQESSALDIADSTIVVDAMNANGTKASYSNYGRSTDVFSPGSAILSTIPTTKTKNWFSYVAEEAGETLAYTGFENDEGEEGKLMFTLPEGQAVVSDIHHMSGQKSLKINGSDGSGPIEITSEAIDLSAKVEKDQIKTETDEDKDLYFGMATQDFKDHYVTVSLPVKTQNETAYHFEPLAIYANSYSEDLWRLSSACDYDAFKETAKYQDGQTIDMILSLSTIARMMSVTQWADDHQYTIDWENFQIKLHIGSIESTVINGEIQDLPSCGDELYLDCVGLGWGADHYDLQSGTSMATPCVTGVYGMVYSQYGKTECNDKLSARIMGSVNTDNANLKGLCVTEGMVDAEKALSADERVFDPVLQTGTVQGDVLTLKGWFLGEAQGSLTINGQAAEIITYTPDKNEAKDDADHIGTIIAKIPENVHGEQVVAYTSADNKTGRIYTDVSRITSDFDEEILPNDMLIGLMTLQIIEGSNGLAFYGLYEGMIQKIFEYDPELKQWQHRFTIDKLPGDAPLPIEPTIFYMDGDYYALPKILFTQISETESGIKEQFFRLTPKTESEWCWKPIGRQLDFVMRLPVVVDHTLYLLGGCKNDMTAGVYYNTLSKVTFNGDDVTITEVFNDPKLFATAQCKAAVVDGKIYVMNFDADEDKIEGGLICVDPEGKTVRNYGYPVQDPDLKPDSFAFAAFGNSLMLTAKFNRISTQVWFFDCDACTWQASDLMLDSAFSKSVSSVACGGKAYVLGKSRNNEYWFLRSLGSPSTSTSLIWQQGSNEDLVFKINIPLNCFNYKVTINDKTLDPSYYTVTEGSTIITLKNACLKKLATGRYTLRAYFNVNGKEVVVPCAFRIIAADQPNNIDTGIQPDNNVWLSIIALMAAGSAILLFAMKKHKAL